MNSVAKCAFFDSFAHSGSIAGAAAQSLIGRVCLLAPLPMFQFSEFRGRSLCLMHVSPVRDYFRGHATRSRARTHVRVSGFARVCARTYEEEKRPGTFSHTHTRAETCELRCICVAFRRFCASALLRWLPAGSGCGKRRVFCASGRKLRSEIGDFRGRALQVDEVSALHSCAYVRFGGVCGKSSGSVESFFRRGTVCGVIFRCLYFF